MSLLLLFAGASGQATIPAGLTASDAPLTVLVLEDAPLTVLTLSDEALAELRESDSDGG